MEIITEYIDLPCPNLCIELKKSIKKTWHNETVAYNSIKRFRHFAEIYAKEIWTKEQPMLISGH